MTMKTYTQISRSSVWTPGWLGWLFLLPALALSLPAQTGPELNITLTNGGTNALISWEENPGEECLVYYSWSLDGPWFVCLEEIARASTQCQMTLQVIDNKRYYRLRQVQSQRFVDDFGDGDIAGWTIDYWDPEATNYLTLDPSGGQLRIHGQAGANQTRNVFFCKTNLWLGDFAMSIDIIDWHEIEGDIPRVSLTANGQMDYWNEPRNYSSNNGGVNMAPNGSTIISELWLMRVWTNGSGVVVNSDPFLKIVPSKDYRLEFYGASGWYRVVLYEILSDGALSRIMGRTVEDPIPLTQGWVGFAVSEKGPGGYLDFTLDNFVAVGTVP